MKLSRRFPTRLKILPGLRWTGKLTIQRKEDDGRYAVEFDAEDPKSVYERFIFDRTLFTAAQVKDWTGVDLEA